MKILTYKASGKIIITTTSFLKWIAAYTLYDQLDGSLQWFTTNWQKGMLTNSEKKLLKFSRGWLHEHLWGHLVHWWPVWMGDQMTQLLEWTNSSSEHSYLHLLGSLSGAINHWGGNKVELPSWFQFPCIISGFNWQLNDIGKLKMENFLPLLLSEREKKQKDFLKSTYFFLFIANI